jgi:hypothetical protein
MKVDIDGFVANPRLLASGQPYKGRFTCHQVQWTASGSDLLATFTMTARELADAAESRLVWTDQDVQRGIKPGLPHSVDREISLSDGYPDPNLYVFDHANADDIAQKLLTGARLFLNPLIWNLRPGTFSGYWDPDNEELYLYAGRIYLPDSHHRQQAILKAVRVFDDDPAAYPSFSPERQFKVELYFFSKEDEGNYFFDKNQRTRPTAKSKAYDLTTLDDLSLLAKRVISKSNALRSNVNRVTDRLAHSNPQAITLSTLRQMMALLAPHESLDETEIEGIAEVAATFYDLLAESRPELAQLELATRREVRDKSLADSAVMMFGYAYLMIDFRDEAAKSGIARASSNWKKRLSRLSVPYNYDGWRGDLFSKDNPLWQAAGVLKPSPQSSRLSISNTGATRAQTGRILRQLLAMAEAPSDLRFLAKP